MVIPKRLEVKINISDLRYHGMPIDLSAVCAQNGLHNYLYGIGVRDKVLITFLHPFSLFQARDVGGMAFSGVPLDTWLAKAQAIYLKELGFPLSIETFEQYREALVTLYLLGSSLCIVQKKTDLGLVYDFVTKNRAVLDMHVDRLAPVDRAKGFDRFKRQLSIQSAELANNAFESVSMHWGGAGIQVDRYRVGSRSAGFVFPYYAVVTYVDHLLKELSARKVRLYYLDALGQECSLLTTYHTEFVAKWMGATPSDALMKKWADWRSSTTVGYISLPDLQQPGRFVSVPVLRITRVTVV